MTKIHLHICETWYRVRFAMQEIAEKNQITTGSLQNRRLEFNGETHLFVAQDRVDQYVRGLELASVTMHDYAVLDDYQDMVVRSRIR